MKKLAQQGIIHIALVIGLIILGISGLYLVKHKDSFTGIEAAAPKIFTNLSSSLQASSATFNFTYSGATSYVINVSTSNNMKQNNFSPFGSGTGSPIVVTNPSIWSKYQCGTTIYWTISAVVSKEVSSSYPRLNPHPS